AGVEMKLRLLDGAKFLGDRKDKLYQVVMDIGSGGIYPNPKGALFSGFAQKGSVGNNFMYKSAEVDKLIDIYEKDLDFNKRLKAMHKLDEIVVKDEVLYIPFWNAPYYRVLYYNNLAHPDNYDPKYTSDFNDYMTWWFESDKPVTDGTFKDTNKVTDVDPYGVLKK
ncbi:MAG: hypothetical protein JXA66_01950, partial [Oligoflexia bacterium]|nr:hypothetical protein [Oligoflexia bacterium]